MASTSKQRTDPVVVRLTIGTRFTNASESGTAMIDRSKWSAMTPPERRDYLEGVLEAMRDNSIDADWHIEDEDDQADTEGGDGPATTNPGPVDADEVMRLVAEYGSLTAQRERLDGRGAHKRSDEVRNEAAALLDQIRAAVTR